MAGYISTLNFHVLPKRTQDIALRFIISKNITKREASVLKFLDPVLREGLLLMRGLLACGIIVFALRDKRYRVDYGLHLERSLLAVPYHAKDIPSMRAEFGHPDVAIVLTCLSYYGDGLTESQLGTCFELLYKLDNPALEYGQWTQRNSAIPPSLRQLDGVNLKDSEQFAKHIFPTFSRNAAAINFFLNSVVFPKEAKQFSQKLCTSGWDLTEIKTHLTTGFSGTNDNRYLLPASISQFDPVNQSSTNALVLTYLLQPENDYYLCIQGTNGETCSAAEVINQLVHLRPEIRVLLDVGAQMLELRNEDLVRYWLKLRPDIAAAVYFNDKDELFILPQSGSPTAFLSSPFAQQMDRCIVYLDDGHTRGTDLKLPKGTRAAVTLGPKVTKDRLLQGCMRMRKLGFGHSVMFCAPPEIDLQIRKSARFLQRDSPITALDVIRWAMFETCSELKHNISHWAQQGIEYNRRAKAQIQFSETTCLEILKQGWVAPESRSLEEMYDPSNSARGASESFTKQAFAEPILRERLDLLGVRHLDDPSMAEEQEREVSHEMERERQVERPPKMEPALHKVHSDIKKYVQTGIIPSSATGLVYLFQVMAASGAFSAESCSQRLIASVDFFKTVQGSTTTSLSDYMRPLHWVLCGSKGVLLALSPFEVNQLLPDIRKSTQVRLHVFAPRVARSMLPFSNLQFYATPSLDQSTLPLPSELVRLQLGMFAGQLYFGDYTQYRLVCGFLGIYIQPENGHESEDVQVQSDCFVPQSDRQKLIERVPEYLNCRFKRSPVDAVRQLVGYRRKGMEYLRTHLGQVLHARQLSPDDF
ncbi:hypothetical protein RhiLY_05890 [Ceratobasidium sp. AG-Ba]|nr:hypothetical protein RhiLY_05890 [Ceratobasidium sp. AG-Ba]